MELINNESYADDKILHWIHGQIFVRRQQYVHLNYASVAISADVLQLTLYFKLAVHILTVTEQENQLIF